MDVQTAMGEALLLAGKAAEGGDVPVGALVLNADGVVIGRGYNKREAGSDPTAHAEIVALRQAGARAGTWNLDGCTLVVTLEPCTMCAGAIVQARVSKLVFGAWEPKTGACGSIRDVVRDARLNHQVEVVSGVREGKVTEQLQSFFEGLRPRT